MTSAPSRRIAVSGALGFVGVRLIPRLRERGDHVISVVRPGREAAAHDQGCEEVRAADLGDPSSFGGVFAGADALVHLAGIAQAAGIAPLLERAGPRRAVFVGSAGVHTRLASASADAKRRAEVALRASSLAYTILRPTMIYGGSGDRNLERLIRLVRDTPVLLIPARESLQQPVHVDDVVDAVLASLDRPAAVRAEYDLGGPEATPLAAVVALIARILARRRIVLPVPIGFVHAGALMLQRFGLNPPFRPEQVLRLVESKAVDIEAARRDLGFHPRGLAEGLAEEVRLIGTR